MQMVEGRNPVMFLYPLGGNEQIIEITSNLVEGKNGWANLSKIMENVNIPLI